MFALSCSDRFPPQPTSWHLSSPSSCLVLSYLHFLLLFSFSVFFLCLCLGVMLCVMLCSVVCGSACGVCGVVCGVVVRGCVCAEWRSTLKTPVCRFKTPPCVHSKRPREIRQHAHMLFNMCTCCQITRGRFECIHGGVLSLHPGRNNWILHVFSLRIDREQHVPDSSNHSLYLMELLHSRHMTQRHTQTRTHKTTTHSNTHAQNTPQHRSKEKRRRDEREEERQR